MNTINSSSIKMDPAQMMQKMQDKLAAADTNQNGSISKAELTESAPKGANQSKIDEMFARLDADENGEVSAEEQQAMMDQMTERMSSLSNGENPMAAQGLDPFSDLLDALEKSPEDKKESNFLVQLKSQQNNNKLNEQEFTRSLKDFTQKYPRVDLQA